MADLSGLSDADLDAVIAGDMAAVSDAGLDIITGSGPTLGSESKAVARRGVEGVADVAQFAENLNPVMGLLNALDLNPGNVGRRLFGAPDQKDLSGQIKDIASAVGLPEQAARTPAGKVAGEVAYYAPGAIGGGAGALRSALAGGLSAGVLKALGAGEGAQAVGGLFGAGAKDIGKGLWGAARSIFKGATPAEVKGSAAQAFKELTGLEEQQLAEALAKRQADELGQYASTAELTDNAGAAQIEKTLGQSGKAADVYNKRLVEREATRNRILDAASPVEAVNKEGLGTELMTKARSVDEAMGAAADKLWKSVPRDEAINVAPEQDALRELLNVRQAGNPLNSKVQNLADQFLGETDKIKGEVLTSGALQDIRSESLERLRDANLTNWERRVLANIQQGVDTAAERAFAPETYGAWLDARKMTRTQAETFKRGTAGGALTEEMARPSNVLANALKGDARSVKELKTAIAGDPELLGKVRRGVLDMIPRDSQGNLTANNMKKFLTANDTQIKELFGKQHYGSMQRILSDLQSQAKVGKYAYRASEGNSVTAQRGTVAGAISDIMAQAVVPGVGPLAQIADAVKRAANVKNKDQVETLLFRAALEPEFALELSKTPTNVRIFDGIERLGMMLRDLRDTPTIRVPGLSARAINAATSEEQKPAAPEAKKKGEPMSIKKAPAQVDDDEALVEAIIKQESGGRADIVSDAGAVGLMQILPSTAKEIAAELGVEKYDLKDPETNRLFGAHYIKKLLQQFGGDVELALTAYHSGPGRVKNLLSRAQGSKLADIKKYLGPVGQKYAAGVLSKMRAA